MCPAVVFYDSVHHGQADPVPPFSPFVVKKGSKCARVCIDAGRYPSHDPHVRPGPGRAKSTANARRRHSREIWSSMPLSAHGIAGIASEIDEDLLDLRRVADHRAVGPDGLPVSIVLGDALRKFSASRKTDTMSMGFFCGEVSR